MKYAKMLLCLCVCALATLCAATLSYALPATIWESVDESVITRGVTLEKIRRFTTAGWLDVGVLRVDLTDEYLSLNALYDSAATRDLTKVKELAEQGGAIAAVNGGFFTWEAGGGGSPIGTVMRSGQIDSAFSETNAYGELMGSVTINKLNEALFAYCTPTITLRCGETAALTAGAYNKKSYYEYKDVTILDHKWVKASVGVSKERPDIVELVVEDGKIRELRVAQPAVEIPANGFVAVTRAKEDGSHPFTGRDFAVGCEAAFEIALNPGLEDAVMHMEGASMLVRDGVIPETFSYEPGTIADKNPRTMVGATEGGQTLILAAVDGRSASMGLTTRESAELMVELGAYNALNLDGGGSTTMVARAPGTETLRIVNSVSEASARAVANGVGVFTSAPRAAIKGLVLESADASVFVGSQRQFSVRAYDRFNNPVTIGAGDIAWSMSGVEGTVENGLLVPKTAGDVRVRAKVGRAVETFNVKVLAAPAELTLSATALSIKPGETHTFSVVARDSMGYAARLSPAEVTWALSDDFGSIERGVFRRSNEKSGYITATFGNAVAYCAVQPLTPDAAAVKPPAPTRLTDGLNREADYAPTGGADTFRIGVLGDGAVGKDRGGAKQAAADAFAAKVSAELDIGAFVGSGSHPAVSAVNKAAYATDGHFEYYEALNGDSSRALIKLSSLGNGLRAAGSGQWGSFIEALNGFSGSDLFIILHQSPSTFNDKLEAALFKQLLADRVRDTGVRIWVFYGGTADSVWLEDGVRYFCLAGAASSAANPATGAGARYLEITVQGRDVTYVNRRLIE